MKTNILVIPTDFSEVASYAVNYGVALAKALSFKVIFVHVLTKESISKHKNEEECEEYAISKLKSLIKEIETKYAIEVDYIIKKGSLFSSLSEVVKEVDASLLTFGTPGKSSGFFEYFKGVDSFKLVSKTQCPNIIVQKGEVYPGEIKNILFPVSTTTKVGHKLTWAKFLAQTFNAKIHIFKLYENTAEAQLKMRNFLHKCIIPEFEKSKIEYVEKEASKNGNFGDQLLIYSNSIKADLIIIMNDPDPDNFIRVYEESLIFNKYQIPIMCVNI